MNLCEELKTNGSRRPPFVIAAALNRELSPLKKLDTDGCEFLTTGMGGNNTGRCLRKALTGRRISGLIFTGLAGALSPDLNIGDIVIVNNFLNNVESKPSPRLLAAAGEVALENPRIVQGSALSVSRVICTAEEKQNIANQFSGINYAVLDMESSAVAESCGALQIPFIVIRSISDRFEEDLPVDFNNCLRADGNLSIGKVLFSVLSNPRTLPGLFELKRRCHCCTTNLASFVSGLRLPALESPYPTKRRPAESR